MIDVQQHSRREEGVNGPRRNQLSGWLFAPVDNSPLVVFRVLFGLLLVAEAGGAILTGWVKETFVDPTYHFPFIWVSWLRPLPGYGMYAYYGLMAALGGMVAAGWYYRLATGAFTLLWWGAYLMQKTHYNNHYYLLILLAGLMTLVPAHRYASLDARRRPLLGRLTCRRWHLAVFVAQLAVVYTYAAVAKLYPDWLAGRPVSIWFAGKSDYPVVGGLLGEKWVQGLVTWGGIGFDLLVVPLLLWRPTRRFAFGTSLLFHLFNSAVFGIGIFPYLMIGMSVFFFPPETIRRLFLPRKPPVNGTDQTQTEPAPRYRQGVVAALAVYLIVQLLLPVRYLQYPGNVHWTEEGHRMAWQMMLRTKSGSIHFRVIDPAGGQELLVSPYDYLTAEQAHALATHPDLIWQFVQVLKAEYALPGRSPRIYAVSSVSLNGRPAQPLVDGSVDLARVEWHPFRHAEWLVPLKE
ncbi:MAG: HTTM domain-containing protein [Cytophagales bacterium]|nr:HTTM domain-containing protein [Cytophagales bacterium]